MAERFRLPYGNALVSVCVEFCDFIAFNFPGGKYKSVSCNASKSCKIFEIRISWKMEVGRFLYVKNSKSSISIAVGETYGKKK